MLLRKVSQGIEEINQKGREEEMIWIEVDGGRIERNKKRKAAEIKKGSRWKAHLVLKNEEVVFANSE